MPRDRRQVSWLVERMDFTRRIQKELAAITLDPPLNCTARPDGDNLYEWVCSIKGPLESVYEGGVFLVDLSLSYS
ncbi:Uncharacterized protein OBRU01_15028 [Operophtera brumata]|uniref:UBC core domain-containing protein n=1 Tax=Operophtera brumata TaxID=104452 RepID=A0A0L7L6S3_OPEBR|nr:Uncharacterized protein OBRU01_15028 [Operophtera brumata]